MKIKKTDISSIFPTIIKNIKLSFEDVNKLLKLMLSILYIVEFKVLVNVRMDNLNDFSKPILSTTRKLDKIKRLKKKEMNIKKEILTFSSDIFLFELKIVLLIILFGLINFNIYLFFLKSFYFI